MNSFVQNNINIQNIPLVNSTQILPPSGQIPQSSVVNQNQTQVVSNTPTIRSQATAHTVASVPHPPQPIIDEDFRPGRGILDDFRPKANQIPIPNSVPNVGTTNIGVNKNVQAMNTNVPIMNSNVPVTNVNVPVMNSNVPAMNTYLPATNTGVPVMNSNIPSMNTNVPIMNSNVPITNTNVPVMNSNIPVMNSNVPIPNANVPVMNSNVPVPNTNAPVMNVNTPLTTGQGSIKDFL